jgi:hypothetical protein
MSGLLFPGYLIFVLFSFPAAKTTTGPLLLRPLVNVLVIASSMIVEGLYPLHELLITSAPFCHAQLKPLATAIPHENNQ